MATTTPVFIRDLGTATLYQSFSFQPRFFDSFRPFSPSLLFNFSILLSNEIKRPN